MKEHDFTRIVHKKARVPGPHKTLKNQKKIKQTCGKENIGDKTEVGMYLGRPLERSWGHLGPKTASRAKKNSTSDFWAPFLGAKLGSKIDQKSILRLS